MSARSTEELIAALAAEARPVRPLPPPLVRAAGLLLGVGLLFAALIFALGDLPALARRYGGRESLMMADTGAMLATGILAVCAAFALSIPGASRRWRLAPLPALLLWIALSGAGCYADMQHLGSAGWRWNGHADCLIFVVAAGLLLGVPLIWLLSRARPIDPVPVAALGGLGAAALAAFLLQFFHPFPVTAIDLAFHILAVLIVVAMAALVRRPALRPA